MAVAKGKTSAPALVGTVKRKRRKSTPKIAKKMVRRRKKVSGIGGEMSKAFEMVLAASGGAIIGKIVQKSGIGKPTASSNTDYRPYIGVAIGVGTMVFVKNPIAKSAGLGCAAFSAAGLIPDKDIPTIGNILNPRTIGVQRISLNKNNRKRMNGNRQRLIAGNSASPLIGKAKSMAGGIGL